MLLDHFRIPMTRVAYTEFLLLHGEMEGWLSSNSEENDCCHFIWGNQSYSSSRYYWFQYETINFPHVVTRIWKAQAVPKIKFFAWLLLNDRLNTRNMLRRRGKYLEEGYCCVLCQDTIEETIAHLFFDCPSGVTKWFAMGIIWDDELGIHDKVIKVKDTFPYPFFMEIFMIGAWCICNERNAFNFERKAPSLAVWKVAFKKEVTEHLFKIKPHLHPSIR